MLLVDLWNFSTNLLIRFYAEGCWCFFSADYADIRLWDDAALSL
jgi:hypothetical protein